MSVALQDTISPAAIREGCARMTGGGIVESFLRSALRWEGSSLDYQPVVRLADGKVVGAEATLRRRDLSALRGGGWLSRRALDLLAREAAQPFAHDERFSLSINLSAEDLEDPDVVAAFRKLRTAVGARPGALVAEITERQLVESGPTLSRILALRDAGIGIAVDEFGTGFSSIDRLRNLAVDALKIDRAFVRRLDHPGATTAVIRHVIRLGLRLGYRVIADGVEHPFQADLLREHGVEYAQGPLFGRPMPMRKLLDLLPGPALA